MRILLITLRADHGGGPKHINYIIDSIDRKFELFLACPEDFPYYDIWSNDNKIIDIYRLPHRKLSLKHFFGLRRFIIKNKIKIVHSHGKGAGIYSRLLKMIVPNIKVIHTFHGVHVAKYNYFMKYFYIFVERILSLLTDKFVNVSKGEYEICKNAKMICSERSVIIYNGIKKTEKIIEAKRILNLNGKYVITTISRYDFQKNMDLAFEIALKLSKYRDIVFMWIGEGEERVRLEVMASNSKANILFFNFTNEIPLYLSATDLYLSTSRWEGLPYALIEAQSFGIPIVATNVVGNNEVVVDGYNGYLFDTHDEGSELILRIYNDRGLYEKLSLNSYNRFNNNFEISGNIFKLERVYIEVGNEKSPNP